MSDDVIRCQLTPIDRNDYRGPMTDAQFASSGASFRWRLRLVQARGGRCLAEPTLALRGRRNRARTAQLEYWAARSVR